MKKIISTILALTLILAMSVPVAAVEELGEEQFKDIDTSEVYVSEEVMKENLQPEDDVEGDLARQTDYKDASMPENDKFFGQNVMMTAINKRIYVLTTDDSYKKAFIFEYDTSKDLWKEITSGLDINMLTKGIYAHKNKLYMIAAKEENGTSNPFLMCYDPETSSFEWIEIPNIKYYKNSTLVSFKNNLLIVGGGEIETVYNFHPNTDIMKIDLENKSLVKVGNCDKRLGSMIIVKNSGEVYLGYFADDYSIFRVLWDKEKKEYQIEQVADDARPTISENENYSMTYAEEGIIVIGSDRISESEEVLSDTYLGNIEKDNIEFSDTKKLFSPTFTTNPICTVVDDKLYVLAYVQETGKEEKCFRYLDNLFHQAIEKEDSEDQNDEDEEENPIVTETVNNEVNVSYNENIIFKGKYVTASDLGLIVRDLNDPSKTYAVKSISVKKYDAGKAEFVIKSLNAKVGKALKKALKKKVFYFNVDKVELTKDNVEAKFSKDGRLRSLKYVFTVTSNGVTKTKKLKINKLDYTYDQETKTVTINESSRNFKEGKITF